MITTAWTLSTTQIAVETAAILAFAVSGLLEAARKKLRRHLRRRRHTTAHAGPGFRLAFAGVAVAVTAAACRGTGASGLMT